MDLGLGALALVDFLAIEDLGVNEALDEHQYLVPVGFVLHGLGGGVTQVRDVVGVVRRVVRAGLVLHREVVECVRVSGGVGDGAVIETLDVVGGFRVEAGPEYAATTLFGCRLSMVKVRFEPGRCP